MREEKSLLMVAGVEGTDLALMKGRNESKGHICLVRSCAEPHPVLECFPLPEVLFSDTELPDGTWVHVLVLASEAERHVPVVVCRVVDLSLHINAVESHASDFSVSPFDHQHISHVLKFLIPHGLAIQAPAAA